MVEAEQWGNRGSHEEEGAGSGRLKWGACKFPGKSEEDLSQGGSSGKGM